MLRWRNAHISEPLDQLDVKVEQRLVPLLIVLLLSVFAALILLTTSNLHDGCLLALLFRLDHHNFAVVQLVLKLVSVLLRKLLEMELLGQSFTVFFKTGGYFQSLHELNQAFANFHVLGIWMWQVLDFFFVSGLFSG